MYIILYARVSTGAQAERELSVPAQLRAMRQRAHSEDWSIAAEYSDVGSGRSLEDRPGLIEAIHHARRDPRVSVLLVHRIDRIARNVTDHLTIRERLRSRGVQLASAVESIEDSPMGEFIELIMAAHAEYYSANLAFEVKKGLQERRRRGLWTGSVPTGYLMREGIVVADPARARYVKRAFELWAAGTSTSKEVCAQLTAEGLVGQQGRPISTSLLCRMLKNRFYLGEMVVNGEIYPGRHTALVSRDLFDRAQEVFAAKRTTSQVRRRHHYLLTGLLRCPHCDRQLTGDQHKKKSGKVYRYYKCTRSSCRFSVRCADTDQAVITEIRELELEKTVLPAVRRRIRAQRRLSTAEAADQVRDARHALNRIDVQKRELALHYANGLRDDDAFLFELDQLREMKRHAEQLLARRTGRLPDLEDPDQQLVDVLRELSAALDGEDIIEQRRRVQHLVAEVSLRDGVEVKWSVVLSAELEVELAAA